MPRCEHIFLLIVDFFYFLYPCVPVFNEKLFLGNMMKMILALAALVALFSMEILAASLNNQQVHEETPAEERTFGLLALFAIWPAIKGFFKSIFAPAAVTY